MHSLLHHSNKDEERKRRKEKKEKKHYQFLTFLGLLRSPSYEIAPSQELARKGTH